MNLMGCCSQPCYREPVLLKSEKFFNRSHTGTFHIRHHDPVRKAAIQAGVFAVIVILGWGLFQLGFKLSGFEETAADNKISKLEERLEFLEKQNQQLSDEAAYMGRTGKIEHEALLELRTVLESREAELIELKEELAFYRSIVSPSDMRPGLHIQNLQLEYDKPEAEYHYRLVLTLVRGQNKVAKGRLSMSVLGTLKGEPKEISIYKRKERQDFSFKYFQRVEGSFNVPEGFEPAQVKISLEPSSKKIDPVEKQFNWADVVELGDA
jgi:hypothetical protein